MRKLCHGRYVSTSTAAAAVTVVLLNCAVSATSRRPLAPVYLTRGMTDHIDCPAKAKPPSTLVVWTVNNHVIDTTSSDRLNVNKRGALIINNVTIDDAGQYMCTQYSPVSDRHPAFNLTVLVKDMPVFVMRPAPIYQVPRGHSITLPCIAEGDPTPSVIWKKVDGKFPPSTRTLQNVGNLTIVQLTREDQGVYECLATNVVTSIITATLLVVQFRNIPYNVTVKTSLTSAKVSWLPAHVDGWRHHHHLVWFRAVGGENWQTVRVVPSNATSLTLHGLRPDTDYQFTVLARDNNGTARFSKLTSATTRNVDDDSEIDGEENSGDSVVHWRSSTYRPQDNGIIPHTMTVEPMDRPAAPVNISARWLSGGEVLLSWQPGSESTVQYVIEYRTVGQWVPLITGQQNTSFVWKTASRGVTYHFRVRSSSHVMTEAGSTSVESRPSHSVRLLPDETWSVNETTTSTAVSAAAVSGLVLLLIIAVMTTVLALAWRRYRIKARQRRFSQLSYHIYEEGNTGISIHRALEGQESPLQSVDRHSVHDNHVTSSTPLKLNHDHRRVQHLHETPI